MENIYNNMNKNRIHFNGFEYLIKPSEKQETNRIHVTAIQENSKIIKIVRLCIRPSFPLEHLCVEKSSQRGRFLLW